MIRIKSASKLGSILLGNSLDHFDTVLYSLLAPLMASTFFPKQEPIVQIIYMYAIFAGSSFTRPAGSIFFGWIASTYGPLKALRFSLFGISCATFLMGILPGYTVFYWIAPILLIILRAFQGIFSAGESAVARFFIMEGLQDKGARKAAYLYDTSTMIGIAGGSLIATLAIQYPYFLKYDSWRLCFLLGGISGFFTIKLRALNKDKNKRFLFKMKLANSILHIKEIFFTYKKEVLVAAILYAFSYSTYALSFIFINAFVPLVTSISYETMLIWNTKLLLLDLILIPILGYFLLCYPPIKIMQTAVLLLGIFLPLFFYFIEGSSIFYVTIVRTFIIVIGVTFGTQINFFLSEKFSEKEKYILLSFSNSIGTAILGRSMPVICLSIWYWSNNIFLTILAPSVLSLSTFFCLLFIKKK